MIKRELTGPFCENPVYWALLRPWITSTLENKRTGSSSTWLPVPNFYLLPSDNQGTCIVFLSSFLEPLTTFVPLEKNILLVIVWVGGTPLSLSLVQQSALLSSAPATKMMYCYVNTITLTSIRFCCSYVLYLYVAWIRIVLRTVSQTSEALWRELYEIRLGLQTVFMPCTWLKQIVSCMKPKYAPMLYIYIYIYITVLYRPYRFRCHLKLAKI